MPDEHPTTPVSAKAALQYLRKRLGFWRDLEPGDYERMNGGDFLAVVDVSADLRYGR